MPMDMSRTPEGDVIILTFTGAGTSPRDERHDSLSDEFSDPELRVLVDVTDIDKHWSLTDLFNEMGYLAQEFGPRMRGLAAVAADPTDQSIRFWEDTAINHGLHAKSFGDKVAALAWLREQ